MTPLRNAARALVLAQSGADIFDDLEPEAQERAVEHVRAVILAIREPSADLRDKVREAVTLWSVNGSEFPSELADDIMDLIDTALSE